MPRMAWASASGSASRTRPSAIASLRWVTASPRATSWPRRTALANALLGGGELHEVDDLGVLAHQRERRPGRRARGAAAGRPRRRWRRAGRGADRSATPGGSRGTAAPSSRSTSRRRPCRRRGRRRCRPRTWGGSRSRRSGWAAKSSSWRRRSVPRGRRASGVGRPPWREPYGELDRAVKNVRFPRSSRFSERSSPRKRTVHTGSVRVLRPCRARGSCGCGCRTARARSGQVASRIGAVRGDVVGIDILERGAGRAIDELAVELPDDEPRPAAGAGDRPGRRRRRRGRPPGRRRPARPAPRRPRDGGACSSGAATTDELLDALCVHGARTVGAEWAVVVDSRGGRGAGRRRARRPAPAWLAAFVAGSRSSAAVAGGRQRPRRRGVGAAAGRRPGPRASGGTVRRSGPGSGGRPPPWPGSSTPGFASSPLTSSRSFHPAGGRLRVADPSSAVRRAQGSSPRRGG